MHVYGLFIIKTPQKPDETCFAKTLIFATVRFWRRHGGKWVLLKLLVAD